MERLTNFLPLASVLAGGWAILNGVLHDIFILAKHKNYDRDLLRLLMDGHILITCGLFLIFAYNGFRNGQVWGYYIAATACISLLVYCGMIFPFLKSLGMITLNLALLTMLVIGLVTR